MSSPKTLIYHALGNSTYMVTSTRYRTSCGADEYYPVYAPTTTKLPMTCAYCGRRTYITPQTTSTCEGCGAPIG